MKYARIAAGGARRHYLGDVVGTVSVTLTDSGYREIVRLGARPEVQPSGSRSAR